MSTAAQERASHYTWHAAAARLRELYDDLAATPLVSCADPPVLGDALVGRAIG
jgi:D-inositol-3-phosphate glycosyltransferase